MDIIRQCYSEAVAEESNIFNILQKKEFQSKFF